MRDDVQFVNDAIKNAGGLDRLDNAVDSIMEHLTKVHLKANGEIFESKNARLAQWDPDKGTVYNIAVAMFTTAMTTEYLTYQAMVGIYNNRIPMEKTLDRVKTTAEIIAMLCLADLIDIHSTAGEYHRITPCLMLEGIPFVDRHGTVYDRPQPVESNWDPDQGSMLLGGRLNHHEEKICLDHINKMNSIPLALNKAFLFAYKEKPKSEKAVDTLEKQELWERYTHTCRHKYVHALVKADRLWLNHKYCTRGRTYAVGYYINSQGSSYKKASLELANKEYLNDEIAFPK